LTFLLVSGDFMGGYRSRLDIIADVLKAAKNGAKKTWIMYKSNLSYELLNKYLSEILSAELIVFKDEAQKFFTTRKGLKFLQMYKEYSRRNKRLENQLKEVEHKRKLLEDSFLNRSVNACLSNKVKNKTAVIENEKF
jgi:predicted transcriptional regulator